MQSFFALFKMPFKKRGSVVPYRTTHGRQYPIRNRSWARSKQPVFHPSIPHAIPISMQWDATSYFYQKPQMARLLLKGADVGSFWNRLSSNTPEHPQTCPLNPKGRLIDWIHQTWVDSDTLCLLGSDAMATSICSWVEQYRFIEDVIITDQSAKGCVLFWNGDASFLPKEWICIKTKPFIHNNNPIPTFLVWATSNPSFTSLQARELSDQEWEAWRIASLYPKAPNEIGPHANPLEMQLERAIHWSKGCYIGQEVISRLCTYPKEQKALVGLYLDQQTWEHTMAGDMLAHQERNVGVITSKAPLFWKRQINALASVKMGSALPAELDLGNSKAYLTNISIT